MGDGTRIEVLDWGGTGDAVMFVHGFGLNAHIWDDIAPRLTNEHRVLALTGLYRVVWHPSLFRACLLVCTCGLLGLSVYR